MADKNCVSAARDWEKRGAAARCGVVGDPPAHTLCFELEGVGFLPPPVALSSLEIPVYVGGAAGFVWECRPRLAIPRLNP